MIQRKKLNLFRRFFYLKKAKLVHLKQNLCPPNVLHFPDVLKMLEIPGKGLCQYLIADIEDVLHVRHFKIARDREIFEICSHIAAVENVLVQRFKTSTHYFSV